MVAHHATVKAAHHAQAAKVKKAPATHHAMKAAVHHATAAKNKTVAKPAIKVTAKTKK
jgi:hypothetical protein